MTTVQAPTPMYERSLRSLWLSLKKNWTRSNKMKRPNRPGALLRLVADLLDRLTPDELDALLDGRSKLEVSGGSTQSKPPRTKGKIADTSAVIAQLREVQTRQQ